MKKIEKTLKEITDDIADNAYELINAMEYQEDLEFSANHIYAIFQSYINAGFTEKQAFELAKIVLDHIMDYEY